MNYINVVKENSGTIDLYYEGQGKPVVLTTPGRETPGGLSERPGSRGA